MGNRKYERRALAQSLLFFLACLCGFLLCAGGPDAPAFAAFALHGTKSDQLFVSAPYYISSHLQRIRKLAFTGEKTTGRQRPRFDQITELVLDLSGERFRLLSA